MLQALSRNLQFPPEMLPQLQITNFITPCIPLGRSRIQGQDKDFLEIPAPSESPNSQCHQQSVTPKHMAAIIYNVPVQEMFAQDSSI